MAAAHRDLLSFPTRRSSDLQGMQGLLLSVGHLAGRQSGGRFVRRLCTGGAADIAGRLLGNQGRLPLTLVQRVRSEEHTSELQSRPHLVCRLLLEKKKNKRSK